MNSKKDAPNSAWAEFLRARAAAIDWLHNQGDTDERIAKTMSMDPAQVALIHSRDRSIDPSWNKP